MSKSLEKEKTNYWIQNLKENDIPATKVNFPEDIFNDEHLKKTNFFKINKHPTEGDLLYPSFPVEFDEDKNENTLHAPNLGENTKDILSGLGFSEFEIDNLASKGVIKI
jgi:crotonobetainyl-CoA:carnitine CoA-transferase CaiB-like acyl-CoA transferase